MKSKIKTLKNTLQKLKEKHEKTNETIKQNNKSIVNWIAKYMNRKVFKGVFVYDIYEDLKRTVSDYHINRRSLLNVYDIHNTLKEDFETKDVINQKQLQEEIIVYQSWIEHLEYVYNIQQVNKLDMVLSLINLRIHEKKQIRSSGDYHVWLRSGVEALEWAKSTI